jgi:HEPN domain-containing protein
VITPGLALEDLKLAKRHLKAGEYREAASHGYSFAAMAIHLATVEMVAREAADELVADIEKWQGEQ